MRKKIFLFSLLIFNLCIAIIEADVSVKLNKTVVSLNETFTATFSATDFSSQPDFSPLKTDFDIISNSQTHNISILNGKAAQDNRWIVVLMGKKEGTFTFPAIQFGSESSSPQTIEIAAPKTIRQDESIFLETELSPKEFAYEQTQLVYTVRLYRSVNMNQASFSDVTINDPNAISEQLGKDIEYEYHHPNGTRYIVFERKFAIFPQRVGELVISPVTFTGQVITGGMSLFNLKTELKRITSKEERITIKAIPAPFRKDNWFAAKNVQLTEEWSADPIKMTLGEPITWTLTLTADGCLGSQIPDISLDLPPELKKYLDKPQISNQVNTTGNIGTKQVKIALIATKEGEITLPAIEMKWWNLQTDQLQIAHLPARIINVLPDPVAMTTSTKELALNTDSLKDINSHSNSHTSHELPLWAWGLISLNLVWIAVWLIALYRKRTLKASKTDSLRKIKSLLKQACQANDPKQAETYFLIWAKLVYPHLNPLNIVDIKSPLSEPLQKALANLYQALYGSEIKWHGQNLWEAFASFKPPKATHSSEKQIEDLLELYSNS